MTHKRPENYSVLRQFIGPLAEDEKPRPTGLQSALLADTLCKSPPA
jgi:hypothetical protein